MTIHQNTTPQLNLDAAMSFAVFAECMNFSVAAQQLHISQPALHVKIRKLSEQLEVPLYVRSGRTLTLTRHGESVARFGREILEQSQGLSAALREGAQGGRICLAAGEGAYLYLLGPAIRRFVGSGGAGLRLLTRDREGALDAVLSGRAQLGVAPLETVPSELEARTLTVVGQMLVVPAHHELASRRRLRLSDLADRELIVPPEERPHRQMLARLLQSADVRWNVAVEANGWELMIRFVQMGVGLAVVNSCCRLPRGLKGIPLPELPTLRYHVFHLKRAARNAQLKNLIEEMHRHGDAWKVA